MRFRFPAIGAALLLLAACGQQGPFLIPPTQPPPGVSTRQPLPPIDPTQPVNVVACYSSLFSRPDEVLAEIGKVCRRPVLLRNEADLDRCGMLVPTAATYRCEGGVTEEFAQRRPRIPALQYQ